MLHKSIGFSTFSRGKWKKKKTVIYSEVKKKEWKRSNRYSRDTDHSRTALKEKKASTVWRGLNIPQSSPVKLEDKCHAFVYHLCVAGTQRGKGNGNKTIKRGHVVLNRRNTGFLSWETTAGTGRLASRTTPGTSYCEPYWMEVSQRNFGQSKAEAPHTQNFSFSVKWISAASISVLWCERQRVTFTIEPPPHAGCTATLQVSGVLHLPRKQLPSDL